MFLAACGVLALALAGGIALALSRHGESSTDPPTRAELSRLQERIEKRRDALARDGIYLLSTGPEDTCVIVELANPTQPNIEFVRRQFAPHTCVARKPRDRIQACRGSERPAIPLGPVKVPSMRDLGISAAGRRSLASGLTYAVDCLGENLKTVKRFSKYSPEQLLRVTKQCPRPGELVPRLTEVALEAVATLPGGFSYKVSSLSRYNTGTSRPCADGRNATRP